MACLTPIVVKSDSRRLSSDYAANIFPCGKCPECLKRRANGWAFRLRKEKEVSTTSCFLTLTYDNDNLPQSFNGFPTLHRKHFPAFMKRLRFAISEVLPKEQRPKIKYYTADEYGHRTLRPHYHAIMFNVPKAILEKPYLFQQYWKHGHVDVGTVTTDSIHYVCGYLMKPFRYLDEPELDDREPHFSLMSKGLGKNFLSDKMLSYYKEHLLPYVKVENGQKVSMPRYYKERLYNDDEKAAVNRRILRELAEKIPMSPTQEIDYVKAEFFNAYINGKKRNKL